MSVDPAFRNLSKHQTCFIIWRIENFSPVPVPIDQYGTFYDGDSYIILSGEARGQPTGVLTKAKDIRGGSLDFKIHYWLGENTTQDESGTAALKTVELDDHLGGSPQQVREVQGHETKKFLAYFKAKGGIKYVKGGAASGFNHVEHTFKPRLLWVKGKHTPRIKEIEIGWDKMNDGDAFLLDVGKAIYVWNGLSASGTEKRKALEYARRIRDDRGSGNIIVINQNEETSDMTEEELEVFEEYLPLKHKNVLKPASAAGADDAYERKSAANLKLWKFSDEGGALKITEIASKPLKKELLDTNDCFIVDNGEAGIWVWTGKRASPKERRESMTNAMAFIKQRNYPAHVPVTKVPESGEPSEFKALFKQWDIMRTPAQMKAYSNNKIAKMSQQTKFDAASLHANPQTAAKARMPDDGSGTKKIWRVERKGNTYELAELDKKHYGQLFGGDSYVILYTYLVNGREYYIIYFWLGKKSTTDEKGVAAKTTVEIDDSLGGAAQQIRVTHGKEPPHFMAMFGGRLVIFAGGKAGWGQSGDEGPGDTYLLQVRGTSTLNCKAEQVPLRAESLNSNDVFVLFSKSSVFVWAGKGCTGDEREMAKQIASISSRGYAMIIEGQEKDDFWSLLGGKGTYSSDPVLRTSQSSPKPKRKSGFFSRIFFRRKKKYSSDSESESESDDELLEDFEPRLFQCSNATGAFCVNEITDFVQDDLVPDDVFILDSGHTVYVWVGDDARPEEKTMAIDTGLDYIVTDPSGYRDPDTPITLVKQGYEPPNFTGFFGVWDRDLWSGGKSYEQLKQELGAKNVSMTQITQKQGGSASFSDVAKYPLEKLRNQAELPDGIDVLHKEKYLTDGDFRKHFGMSYANFVSKPLWKQQQMKKDLGLF